MKKMLKFLFVILILLLMFTFFSIIVFYQGVINLPFYLLPLDTYPVVGQYFPAIFFWLSVILFFICLIALFVIIFYPQQISSIKLKEEHGKLMLDKKAIQGFVKAALEKEAFIKSPKTKVKMTKHKIKIKIVGDLKRTSDLYEKNDQLVNEIKTSLNQLLGVQQQVTIDVTYQRYRDQKTIQSARVV